jgi:hypothetical protein
VRKNNTILPGFVVGFFAVAMSCFLARPSDAQSLPEWTFSLFLDAAVSQKMAANISPENNKNLASIGNAASLLRSAAVESYGSGIDSPGTLRAKLPEAYWRSMAFDYSLLIDRQAEMSKHSDQIASVAADLSAKLTFLNAVRSSGPPSNLTGNFPATIKVTVTTVGKDGAPRSGLYVRANPEAYGINSPPLYVFNSATSPRTSGVMPPGRAIIWIEDSSRKVLQSQPVSLGDLGSATAEITVALP